MTTLKQRAHVRKLKQSATKVWRESRPTNTYSHATGNVYRGNWAFNPRRAALEDFITRKREEVKS
jgi:hypothetical protein